MMESFRPSMFLPALVAMVILPFFALAQEAPPPTPQVRPGWPTPLSGFDPAYGLTGVWESTTTINGKAFRQRWRVAHALDQNAVGFALHPESKPTEDALFDNFARFVQARDPALLEPNGIETTVAGSELVEIGGEKYGLRLNLEWRNWGELRGTFTRLKWQVSPTTGWAPDVEWPTTWRRMTTTVTGAQSEWLSSTDAKNFYRVTLTGDWMPLNGQFPDLNGDFPYTLKFFDSRIQAKPYPESRSAREITIEVEAPKDISPGVKDAYLAGKHVSKIILSHPPPEEPLIGFVDDAGREISEMVAGGRFRVQLVTHPQHLIAEGNAYVVSLRSIGIRDRLAREEAKNVVVYSEGKTIFRSRLIRLWSSEPKAGDASAEIPLFAPPGTTVEAKSVVKLSEPAKRVVAKLLVTKSAEKSDLFGRVTEVASGRPLEGAVLKLDDYRTGIRVASAITDASGKYLMAGVLAEKTDYQLTVRMKDYGSARQFVAGSGVDEIQDFQLSPVRGVIAGVITQAGSGKPVQGAIVKLVIPSLSGEDELLETWKTAADGAYRFQGLTGRYRIIVTHDSHLSASRDLQLEKGASEKSDIELIFYTGMFVTASVEQRSPTEQSREKALRSLSEMKGLPDEGITGDFVDLVAREIEEDQRLAAEKARQEAAARERQRAEDAARARKVQDEISKLEDQLMELDKAMSRARAFVSAFEKQLNAEEKQAKIFAAWQASNRHKPTAGDLEWAAGKEEAAKTCLKYLQSLAAQEKKQREMLEAAITRGHKAAEDGIRNTLIFLMRERVAIGSEYYRYLKEAKKLREFGDSQAPDSPDKGLVESCRIGIRNAETELNQLRQERNKLKARIDALRDGVAP